MKGNELVSSHQAAALLQRSLGEFLVLTGTDMLFSLFPSPPFLVSLPISLSPLLFLLPFVSPPICHSVFFLLPTLTLSAASSSPQQHPLPLPQRQLSALGSPTSSITVLYIHTELRLSMIHPHVTAGRPMKVFKKGWTWHSVPWFS